jgi:type IV pilus biogenesis protein CpaD/CtpE
MPCNNRIRGCRMLAMILAVTTTACSDLYYDRRETISRFGGDAAEANKAAQVIDPWPAVAADRVIETDGERMQRAVERYRTNKTTPLATTPSPVQYQPVLAPAQQPGAAPSQ